MIVVSQLDDITSFFTPRLMWEILYKYSASTRRCVTRPLKDGSLLQYGWLSLCGTGAHDL